MKYHQRVSTLLLWVTRLIINNLILCVLGCKSLILDCWKHQQHHYTFSFCSLQTGCKSQSLIVENINNIITPSLVALSKHCINVFSSLVIIYVNNINVNRYNDAVSFILSFCQVIKSLLLLSFTQYADWNIIILWYNCFVFSGESTMRTSMEYFPSLWNNEVFYHIFVLGAYRSFSISSGDDFCPTLVLGTCCSVLILLGDVCWQPRNFQFCQYSPSLLLVSLLIWWTSLL